jgi:acetolactate decarboxylase
MKTFSCVAFLLCFFLLSSPPEVKTAGEMKNIMQKGDLSAHIALDTLLTTTHIYGLGPAEGIKGELMILDSKAYWCKVENGITKTSFDNSSKAAMLVYCRVPDWKSIAITGSIKDYASLEKTIEKLAVAHGQTLDKPFPFIIRGDISVASWHVIDWREGATHTFDNHKQFAVNGSTMNESVTLLGFYSNKHHGIFTHHSTNMHVHIMDGKSSVVGHLEEFSSRSSLQLSLSY